MSKKTKFYPRMAISNVKKNGTYYFAYLFTCLFTVAMFYIMGAVTFDDSLKSLPDFQAMILIMRFGTAIIGIFSVVFLFYTNSFLMKRRQKEFGLYNILGMEKRHICTVLFWETAFIALVAIVGGIGFGILLNQLILLLLGKMIHLDFSLKAKVSVMSLEITVILFVAIFALILLSHIFRIGKAKPIELLRGSNVGEKEPKAKWFMALLSFVLIGIGYYISITTVSPLEAIPKFFLAVLLVVIGTYLLFTAGSIAILKALKKNKKFYYQTAHFTSISGMLYRMKQNAVGMGNICVLCTRVLVMFSATVSLYAGSEEMLEEMHPKSINICFTGKTKDLQESEISKQVQTVLDKYNIEQKDCEVGLSCTGFGIMENGKIKMMDSTANMEFSSEVVMVCMATQEGYESTMKDAEPISLKENEIALWTNAEVKDTVSLFGSEYTVSQKIDELSKEFSYYANMLQIYYVVVKDMDSMYEMIGDKSAYDYTYSYGFCYSKDPGKKLETMEKKLKQSIRKAYKGDYDIAVESQAEYKKGYYSIYGGLMFIGVFLGILFLMAAALIIYYKQISEGYEDKEKFAIMEKVGMTKKEIKSSIGSQVVMIFFLPLLVSCVHVAGAFPLIRRLLLMFGLTNVSVFILCTVITILIFSLIYGIVYRMTARTYYKIVTDMQN